MDRPATQQSCTGELSSFAARPSPMHYNPWLSSCTRVVWRQVLGSGGNCPATFAVVPREVVPRSRPRRQPLQRSIAATDWIPLSHLWASARLSPIVFLTSAQIVIGHRPHGYWTSVQSIDRMRWRNVYTLVGLPVSSESARGSPARGAPPRLRLAPQRYRCETSAQARARHWTTVQSISSASSP
jgi:hypothetical protein